MRDSIWRAVLVGRYPWAHQFIWCAKAMAPHARDKCETNKTGGVLKAILEASNQLYAGKSDVSDSTRKGENLFGADHQQGRISIKF